MKSMFDILVKEQTRPIKVIERSIFSSRYLFTNMAFDKKLLTNRQYSLLISYFESLVNSGNVPEINKIIYLDMPIDVCHSRVTSRNRNEEMNIPIKYLETLNMYYDNWLTKNMYPLCAKSITHLKLNENDTIGYMRKCINEIMFNNFDDDTSFVNMLK